MFADFFTIKNKIKFVLILKKFTIDNIFIYSHLMKNFNLTQDLAESNSEELISLVGSTPTTLSTTTTSTTSSTTTPTTTASTTTLSTTSTTTESNISKSPINTPENLMMMMLPINNNIRGTNNNNNNNNTNKNKSNHQQQYGMIFPDMDADLPWLKELLLADSNNKWSSKGIRI